MNRSTYHHQARQFCLLAVIGFSLAFVLKRLLMPDAIVILALVSSALSALLSIICATYHYASKHLSKRIHHSARDGEAAK